VPTAEGPLGAVVSEPRTEPRAALILLGGYGRPARSGTNGFWTRTARACAEAGLVVVRADYSREGESGSIVGEGNGLEWKVGFDLALMRQLRAWFSARIDGLPLLLAGACGGARLSIELAGLEPSGVAGTFLVVPHLETLVEPGADGEGPESVDPIVVERLRTTLRRAASWILVGEHDSPDVPELERRLGPEAARLRVEVARGVALHLLDQPHLQELTARWLSDRIDRALVEHAKPAAATG